jgi:hypothetical protein
MQLFLDKDGVLADFDRHVLELFGDTPRKLGDKRLWECVDATPDFWITIPMKEGADELMEVAAPYNPIILTGCPVTGYDIAAASKPKWIGNRYGPSIKVITCLSKDKPLHMIQPGDILVDDFIVNVKRWRAAGGQSVWYKTPEEGLASLRRKLERLSQ